MKNRLDRSHIGYLQNKKKLLAKKEFRFLGHIINAEGIKPLEELIQAVKCVCPLKTIIDVKSFFGLSSYRNFIPNYGLIAKHLNTLTAA